MCGIAGIISADPNQITRQRLKRMTDAIRHRGPEGEGVWLNATSNAGFGHRRLAIIDLSDAGRQPMHYLDRYTIVYNGELYNYVEIREQLEGRGYTFSSHTDTEVILAAYACYHESCLNHFDGMFAFAIWDEKEQTLFAARDRFGEKPFYYHLNAGGQTLVFASEMKALWQAGIAKNMSGSMMLNYLTLGYVQNPADKSETFYTRISSLPPSHFIRYDYRTAGFRTMRYYDIDAGQQGANEPEHKAIFLEYLTRSVKRRLRSDVPVGTSLSGGIDSSSIAALIKQVQATGHPQPGVLKTFSAVFPGFEKDESAFIKLVTNTLKIENYQVSPSADHCIREFETLCHHQEEPFTSGSVYAQFKVFELARQHDTTVLLDGQGADEILAGYTRYIHWYLQELFTHTSMTRFYHQLAALRKGGIPFAWNWKNYVAAWMPGQTARQLAARELKKKNRHPHIAEEFYFSNAGQHFPKPVVRSLNDMLYYNCFVHGLEELLRYADRNSMAHGREVRLPFLYHELVEFCFRLPATSKIASGYTKHLLRLSMNDYLPPDVVWQTGKTGFEPPQKQWMHDPHMQDYMHEAKKNLVTKGILEPGVLQDKIQPQQAHAADNYDWRYLVAGTMVV